MRLSGSRSIPAPPEAIWAFLHTPERLRRCLPGCERFEAVIGPNKEQISAYQATMRLGIAFFKGTYSGTIRLAEQRRPEYLVLAVDGGGALGTLSASGNLTLRELGPGLTEVAYDGEARVDGRVAVVGERVMGTTAERLIGLFFDCMTSHLGPSP